MLPKAVTPSNKHALCQWLFVRPSIDCVILSLWKNTSSGTINYKLLLHTSRAWCCLHPAVTGRSKAKPRSKGRELLKWTRHHPLQSTIWSKMACTCVPHQNLLKKFWSLLCAEEIFSPRCLDASWCEKNIFLHRAFFVPMLWCFAAFSSRLIGIISFSCLAVFCALTKLPGFLDAIAFPLLILFTYSTWSTFRLFSSLLFYWCCKAALIRRDGWSTYARCFRRKKIWKHRTDNLLDIFPGVMLKCSVVFWTTHAVSVGGKVQGWGSQSTCSSCTKVHPRQDEPTH